MLQIHRLRLDHGALEGENRRRVTNNPTPCFSWAAAADGKERRQAACRVTVSSGASPLWDSGWIEQEAQELRYAGPPLPAERRIAFTVEIRDACGEQSPPASAWFYLSALPGLPANWIAPQEDVPGRPLYFRRRFAVRPGLESAALYICGLGYHQAALDGVDLTDAVLDPAVTDYSKRVSYVFLPELEERLGPGEHCLSVVVAEGWRRNEGPYLRCIGERAIPFFGRPQLSALLRLGYADGTVETVEADESWLCGTGEIVSAHLFNGETTDRRQAVPGWNRADGEPKEFQPARRVPPPGGVPEVMELEPIREQERVPARSVTPLRDGVSIVDFGKNLAGVCRLKLPDRLLPGQEIVLEHMEFLDEDGDLYLPTLRGARCRDTYIAAGDGQDPAFWQPRFTYHGFRYARVTGLPLVDKADIQAVVLRTDAAPAGVFTCGSGLVNAIQAAIVQTERSNMHSLLTDCPQRDERMGWLNDATVRFEETPYNFDIGRLFPKVIRDILDTQEADGSITCTAPRIYGERPADPVCSSFLVAGLQALLHTGNLDILRQAYDGFVRWEECLEGLADGYILRYSHYGDWAGPVYACEGGDTDIDAVRSAGNARRAAVHRLFLLQRRAARGFCRPATAPAGRGALQRPGRVHPGGHAGPLVGREERPDGHRLPGLPELCPLARHPAGGRARPSGPPPPRGSGPPGLSDHHRQPLHPVFDGRADRKRIRGRRVAADHPGGIPLHRLHAAAGGHHDLGAVRAEKDAGDELSQPSHVWGGRLLVLRLYRRGEADRSRLCRGGHPAVFPGSAAVRECRAGHGARRAERALGEAVRGGVAVCDRSLRCSGDGVFRGKPRTDWQR